MLRIYRALFLMAIAMTGLQCQKEVSYIGAPDPGINILPQPVTATLQGNILDENNQPLANVHIRTGNSVAFTDAKGYFRITNSSLDGNASVVVAEKEGYFPGYRTFRATSGTNQVVIQLLARTLAGTFSAASGGEVSLPNGTKISFPAMAIGENLNSAYSGTVKVFAHYIDPTSSEISRIVPGSFMADNASGQRVTMASFGMVAVELESTGGLPLQIMQGKSASLVMPIPAILQSSAPASIALWYLDKTSGIWKEEGSATRDGNNYKGTVSHFSFWNCDIGLASVTLSLTVKNSDGQPIVHAQVRLSLNSPSPIFAQSYGYTDSLGQVSGLVPANSAMTLDVLSECGTSIYSQSIQPLTQNTNLGTITVNNTTNILTVKGTVVDCNSNPVTNGYAVVSLGNTFHYISVDATGNYQLSFIICSNTTSQLEVIGYNAGTQQQGTPVAVTVTLPVTQTGNVTACGVTASQFVNYLYDAVNYIFSSVSPVDSIMGYMTPQAQVYKHTISAMKLGTPAAFDFSFNTNSPSGASGTYPMTSVHVNYMPMEVMQPCNVNITNFPSSVGQFYEGSISGMVRDSLNFTHTLNGTFRVRRNF